MTHALNQRETVFPKRTKRKNKIAKGQDFGRTLTTDYNPELPAGSKTTSGRVRKTAVSAVITRHATKGIRVRSTRSMGWGS